MDPMQGILPRRQTKRPQARCVFPKVSWTMCRAPAPADNTPVDPATQTLRCRLEKGSAQCDNATKGSQNSKCRWDETVIVWIRGEMGREGEMGERERGEGGERVRGGGGPVDDPRITVTEPINATRGRAK